MIRLAFFCIGFICLTAGCQQKRQQSTSTEAQDTLVQVGNDRDEHGCIASAGYVWSEVRKDCIRPFEEGVRMESTDQENLSLFLVFSQDSSKVELFFSDGRPNEILDQRKLPKGGFAWNVEDDDTKNVRKDKDGWTVSQRNRLIFQQVTQPEKK